MFVAFTRPWDLLPRAKYLLHGANLLLRRNAPATAPRRGGRPEKSSAAWVAAPGRPVRSLCIEIAAMASISTRNAALRGRRPDAAGLGAVAGGSGAGGPGVGLGTRLRYESLLLAGATGGERPARVAGIRP